MEQKGSITVMLSLILTIILALICASLQSAQQAAARAVAANSADAAVSSVFAEYDTELLEVFDVFFLDGTYGSGTLNLARVTDRAERAAGMVLETELVGASLGGSGITAYQLASDELGAGFRRQAVLWVKSVLGQQAISYLLSHAAGEEKTVKRQEEEGEKINRGEPLEDYDRMVEEAALEQPEETIPVEISENPIEVFRSLRKMGILGLLLPGEEAISEKKAELKTMVSHRSVARGMGDTGGKKDAAGTGDTFLYQEYLLKKLSCFGSPVQQGDLDYQIEYILGGADGDTENLKRVVKRLLLIREGANYVHLYQDPVKRGQAASLALTLASAVGIPQGEKVVEALLMLCWAYGESLLDVRRLLKGGKVPMIKDTGSWRLQLHQLPRILELLQEDPPGEEKGTDYRGYLRILLCLNPGRRDSGSLRALDMVENVMRKRPGKADFRLDACIESLELEVAVKGPGGQPWTLIRSYGYDMEVE